MIIVSLRSGLVDALTEKNVHIHRLENPVFGLLELSRVFEASLQT
jgi:hypothetical protein